MATIQGVYVALFGRPADPAGLTYFNSVTKSGADLSGIGDLASTQEYKDRFAGQNNTQIVNAIYQSLFGRDAEAAGLNFFVDALNKGTMNIKNIAINILDGAQGSDKTTVTNKVAAADLYTKSLDTAAEIGSYVGNSAAAQGRAFISGVTTTVPTQAAVDAAILTMQAAGAAGNTITATANIVTLDMTTGIGAAGDVKTTTNNNDTINASTFLTATSKIDGGLGVDTVNASVAANLAIGTDGLKNVEIFNVKATAASTVDLTNASGLQQAWNDNSTKALTFDKIAASTTVGLKGTIADATTFTYANTAGTNTANVSLDSAAVTAGKAVTISATEIVNIANSGTSSVDTLTLDAGQTVNISGSGTLSLGIVSTTVDTVSASAFTGKLTYDATNNTAIKAVAGGAGADTLTISTVHSNDVTVNGGAGTDTLTVNNNGNATKAIVLTGGADADQFVFGTSVGNVQAVDTNANFVKTLITVSDFTASADAIKVAVGGASPRDVILAAEQAQITGQSDLLSAAQKAASYTDVNKASVFTYGGDAYILVQNGNAALDAGDTFIKVTGVTDVATFTATNFQIS